MVDKNRKKKDIDKLYTIPHIEQLIRKNQAFKEGITNSALNLKNITKECEITLIK